LRGENRERERERERELITPPPNSVLNKQISYIYTNQKRVTMRRRKKERNGERKEWREKKRERKNKLKKTPKKACFSCDKKEKQEHQQRLITCLDDSGLPLVEGERGGLKEIKAARRKLHKKQKTTKNKKRPRSPSFSLFLSLFFPPSLSLYLSLLS
jgi:hypothetical protein